MFKDTIGDRMKAYENCYRFYLPKRSPVVVRIDGRAFHSFTKGFRKPYDHLFAQCMWFTARRLCEEVSGVKFAFTQSDEITLVLVDYENINTEPWFGNNLQKIASVTASMATLYFNQAFSLMVNNEGTGYGTCLAHTIALNERQATFDSRAFVIPREEIFNIFYWRQLDCKRNSIQLVGQANFSHKQLQNKTCSDIQKMLLEEKGVNWEQYPNWFRNGVSIYKHPIMINNNDNDLPVIRYKWMVDTETPVFIENKNYIMRHFEKESGNSYDNL